MENLSGDLMTKSTRDLEIPRACSLYPEMDAALFVTSFNKDVHVTILYSLSGEVRPPLAVKSLLVHCRVGFGAAQPRPISIAPFTALHNYLFHHNHFYDKSRLREPIAFANMSQEAALDVLCRACQILFDTDPSLSTRIVTRENLLYIAHHRISALRASGDNGCHLCTLILAQLTGHKSTPAAEEWEHHQKQDAQIWIRFSLHNVEPNMLMLYAGEPPEEEGLLRSGLLFLCSSDSMCSH